MQYKNLSVIGTSHIARESIEEIKDFIGTERPDIIALELDRSRFLALTSKKKRRTDIYSLIKVGLNGFLFMILGQWAQRALGKMVGVKPGSEMLTAIKLAKDNKIALVLIDQDIQITLARFSKALTIKETFRILWDIIFGAVFKRNELKKLGISSLDLRKVPEDHIINKLIGVVRERYPHIYSVLVEERNVFMARNLANLIDLNPDKKILAIVGAGHEKELIELVRLFRNDAGMTFEVNC